jgi:hypothetical protein
MYQELQIQIKRDQIYKLLTLHPKIKISKIKIEYYFALRISNQNLL